jgi:histidine triad (HIT) family protein
MCIFCEIANGRIPSYTIYEDDNVRAFLDLSQATAGHTLIVPKKHYENLFDLSLSDAKAVAEASKKVADILKDKLNVEAVNLINNSGQLAGQTVMHFHLHVIPRYKTDDIKIEFNDHSPSKEELEKMHSMLTK